MKYLSVDIEATGLMANDLIIEFASVPICSQKKEIFHDLSFHSYVKCPSFDQLKPRLNQWVIEHNKDLIDKAHLEGRPLESFQSSFSEYLQQHKIKELFDHQRITLFGKSMNAIDLPFLNRDLGEEFMRQFFEHRYLDLSSVAYTCVDLGKLPLACRSGSELMKHFSMGDVAHTALEDAVNTAKLYFKILSTFE